MEKLNQNMPKTFFGWRPDQLLTGAGPVKAQPFYQVPASPSSTKPVQSEYAYSCFIIDTFGEDMVLVRFEWESVPGSRQQAFYPHELHLSGCICRACKGDHLHLIAAVAA